MTRIRPVGHDDHLSIVEHLDELRSRIIVCVGALFVAFCFCFWQNQPLINALNRPLPKTPASQGLASEPDQLAKQRAGVVETERALAALSHLGGQSRAVRHFYAEAAQGQAKELSALPKSVQTHVEPVTLGVGESFTTTLLVVGYFSLVFALPLIIYQLYAFVIPALAPNERRVATPVMIISPLLFIAGAVFTYFMILPPAIHFLQGYNSRNFDILVQAKTYYRFEMLLMIGIGIAFQVPLGLLALQRVGMITARTLTVNWRYAVVIIAVIAAALPGVDPVTMGFEMLPLAVLYFASIVMLKIFDRRDAKRAAVEFHQVGSTLDPS